MRRFFPLFLIAAAIAAVLPARADIELSRPPCTGGDAFSCQDLRLPGVDGALLDATLYTRRLR